MDPALLNDTVGFTGVFILLVAFLLNLMKKISQDSLLYIILNCVGAGMACLASVLISYIPFIILEGTWTIVSLIALFNFLQKKKRLPK